MATTSVKAANAVIDEISEALLAEADGPFIQRIANQILTRKVRYLEDGYFEEAG